MPPFRPVDDQFDILRRGADSITTEDELRKKLQAGRPLRVKYGIDPTGFDVHLGHTVPLRKLRQFQELGHTAVLIIGTATAAVGDPSGRDEARQGLTPEQIDRNAESYLAQIARVIDIEHAEVVRNDAWFGRFDFARVLRLLGQMTVQRMLERDDFTKRVQSGVPIYLHECLYPLMQGHDSVEVRADVELGGTEQLFNLMVGRRLQAAAGQEPQVCLTMPILRGLDGEKKMGKSLGNYIGVGEPAKEQFGKTMRIPDGRMREWFTLLTGRGEAEIATILAGHPNEAKKLLAGDIVRFYHGDEVAAAVLNDWRKQFEQRGVPDQIESVRLYVVDRGGERFVRNVPPDVVEPNPKAQEFEHKVLDGDGVTVTIVNALLQLKLAQSGSNARLKIFEGAVAVSPQLDQALRPDKNDKLESIRVNLAEQTVRLGRRFRRAEIVVP